MSVALTNYGGGLLWTPTPSHLTLPLFSPPQVSSHSLQPILAGFEPGSYLLAHSRELRAQRANGHPHSQFCWSLEPSLRFSRAQSYKKGAEVAWLLREPSLLIPRTARFMENYRRFQRLQSPGLETSPSRLTACL